MKAIVKTKVGKGNVEYIEVNEPQVSEGQVKIEVKYGGICGTDIKIRHGHVWSNPPVILGHEYSGIVTKVGKGVTDIKVGDRVVSETAQIVCGKCEYCMSGNYLMCQDRLSIGYGTNGAFGKYIVVRQEIVHRIPNNVSLEEAALCEPAAVAFHAVFDFVEIRPYYTIAVFGPGAIGQLVAQLVKSLGANVILCGTSKDSKRLDVAEKLGIMTLVTDNMDVPEYMTKLTGGKGIDYAFDCTGVAPAISQALNCIKRKGSLIQVGLTAPKIQIDYDLIALKEISIRGAFGHDNQSWHGILKMMSQGKIDVKPLISHHFSFEEWEKAFDTAENLNGIKVLLHP